MHIYRKYKPATKKERTASKILQQEDSLKGKSTFSIQESLWKPQGNARSGCNACRILEFLREETRGVQRDKYICLISIGIEVNNKY